MKKKTKIWCVCRAFYDVMSLEEFLTTLPVYNNIDVEIRKISTVEIVEMSVTNSLFPAIKCT